MAIPLSMLFAFSGMLQVGIAASLLSLGAIDFGLVVDSSVVMVEIKTTLPPGVEVATVYDRTELVDAVIKTVQKNLFEGGLLVVAVLFVFLGNLRAGLIVALAIPLSMLFAFSGMLQVGIAASLLSLGAIDFDRRQRRVRWGRSHHADCNYRSW